MKSNAVGIRLQATNSWKTTGNWVEMLQKQRKGLQHLLKQDVESKTRRISQSQNAQIDQIYTTQ